MKSKIKNRLNKLILGQQTVEKIEKCRVLVVGAGGIGCQLLKNLSKFSFKKITILDLDSIQITNLNRQFYFRKDHIGQSKAQIAKQSLLLIDSSLQIQAINDNIMNTIYNQLFYEQFDLVYSCLDSMKVRQYLASQTTKNNIPLIDAGTSSYYGQAYANVRFINNCHNCNPSDVKQNVGAYCTIRSRPQNPMHCATYAKNFYDSFFGGDLNESLSENLKIQRFITKNIEQYNQNDLKIIAILLFTQLFDQGIRDVDIQGNKIDVVRKLKYQDAIKMVQLLQNPQKSTYSSLEHQKQLSSIYQQQKIWSISKYTQKFITSLTSLIRRYYNKQTPIKFEKDDDDCMSLVLTITNLRTFNFMNFQSLYNKHKYLTYYQCKDLIGKVFPAISSTNSIAAALQLRQSLNIINKQYTKLRYISFSNNGDERLSPAFQSKPNIDCDYCSQKIIYAKVVLNMNNITFRQLQEYTNYHLLTMNRDISCGSNLIIRNSKNQVKNKDKKISFLRDLNMINNNVLSLTFRSYLNQPNITIYLAVIHDQDMNEIILKDTKSRQQLKDQLISYFRVMRIQEAEVYKYEMSLYGGYQL